MNRSKVISVVAIVFATLLALSSVLTLPAQQSDEIKRKLRLIGPDSISMDSTENQNQSSESDVHFLDKMRVEEIAVQHEKQQWEALKMKDKASYAQSLANDFISVGTDGITTKVDEKNLPDQLTLTDYKWEQVRAVRFKPDVVLVVYKATQKAVLRGQAVPTPTSISSLWIMRKGKWLNAFYQETKTE